MSFTLYIFLKNKKKALSKLALRTYWKLYEKRYSAWMDFYRQWELIGGLDFLVFIKSKRIGGNAGPFLFKF